MSISGVFFIASYLIFRDKLLTDWLMLASKPPGGPCLPFQCHATIPTFCMWLWGVQVQVPMLVSQALYRAISLALSMCIFCSPGLADRWVLIAVWLSSTAESTWCTARAHWCWWRFVALVSCNQLMDHRTGEANCHFIFCVKWWQTHLKWQGVLLLCKAVFTQRSTLRDALGWAR